MRVSIHDLPTPALLVDLDVLEENVGWMANRADALGVALRPHLKTHKCVEIARLQREAGARGATVATLEEARAFAHHGFEDLTWAFPVIPGRIDEALAIAERIDFRLLVDSEAAVEALEATRFPFHVWLEIDCGDHRSGVPPGSEAALGLARRLADSPTLRFDGVLTHAGQAYRAPSRAGIEAAAAEERDVTVGFAQRARAEGIELAGVSVGSTPTMRVVDRLEGVTEIRPGNYVYFDLTMVSLGVCEPSDCALTVLASVVSSPPGADHSVVDAGALALSKDAGRSDAEPASMGRIFADPAAGTLREDTRLVSLSQEHGVVSAPLPIGQRVRILPNHSCLAAACFDSVHAVRGEEVVAVWPVRRER
ncbi:MAG: alanine racemase [Gemmatimonadota bacterium]|nr:alanine racemase [Gemmatimonadota bacterium]